MTISFFPIDLSCYRKRLKSKAGHTMKQLIDQLLISSSYVRTYVSPGTEPDILMRGDQIIFFLKYGLKYEYILRQIVSKLNIT
jgi:hypothetical protein